MKKVYFELAKGLLLLTKDQTEDEAGKTVTDFAKYVQKRYGPEALMGVERHLPSAIKILEGTKTIDIETARPTSDEVIAKALESLGIKMDGLEIKKEIKPELIGGIRIRKDDTLIDATIRRKLNKLSQVGS